MEIRLLQPSDDLFGLSWIYEKAVNMIIMEYIKK